MEIAHAVTYAVFALPGIVTFVFAKSSSESFSFYSFIIHIKTPNGFGQNAYLQSNTVHKRASKI